jgi:D-beta-D-heptose 7-phosphate kinase/D-beta-D-heptose 1-phosphate adenosyltransferase
MIDVYDFCYTAHSRPSPELPDRLVYTAHRSEKMLGGAGNVAANLASLGVQTTLLSICGEDGNALEARRLCDAAGIRHVFLTDRTRPTTIKTRLYIDDRYLLRRDDERTHKVTGAQAAEIEQEFSRVLDHADAVILSDYNKGFFAREPARTMIRCCRARSIPVVVDLKPPNAAFFCGATVAVPNLKEAREICPGFDPYQSEESLRSIHRILGADKVMVTIGAEGMLVYEEGQAAHVPGRKVHAVDPCGCGDTVRAGLTLGLVAGFPLAEAARFANFAASLAVQKLGTATLSPQELLSESRGALQ